MAQWPAFAIAQVEAYLVEQRSSEISWHLVLNNHASTRPKACGGPVARAVTECKDVVERYPRAWDSGGRRKI